MIFFNQMFRPGAGGLGNLFILLSQVETVSDAIYGDNRGKYMKLENVNVIPDDGTLPSVEPKCFLNQPVHTRIRDILKPTDLMQKMIDDHEHLVNGVEFAFQIRRCGLVKNKEAFKEIVPNDNFCTDETLEKFYYIMEKTSGNVFVTSDCQEVKRTFKQRWPDRVRILDEQPVMTSPNNGAIDPWVSFLEFFLLSKCPMIFVTGGDPVSCMYMSTFGYMAAVYGNQRYTFIFNTVDPSHTHNES